MYEVVFCKNWEHGVINNMFENFATDWVKRDRSVVFNTLSFFVNCYDICFFPFWWENAASEQIWRWYKMDLSHNLSMRIMTISWPWASFESSLLIMFLIFSIEKLTSESDLPVINRKSNGNVHPLSINEHCFAKKELKISLFSLKQQ